MKHLVLAVLLVVAAFALLGIVAPLAGWEPGSWWPLVSVGAGLAYLLVVGFQWASASRPRR